MKVEFLGGDIYPSGREQQLQGQADEKRMSNNVQLFREVSLSQSRPQRQGSLQVDFRGRD